MTLRKLGSAKGKFTFAGLVSCALSLRVDGVTLLRIRPDNVRIELVLAWPKQADSPVTRTFLDLVNKRHDLIHRKATVVS